MVKKPKIAVPEASSVKPATPGSTVAFNPQPEPPGNWKAGSSKPSDPGTMVSFNPQPEPPGDWKAGSSKPSDPGSMVAFNPQPEPPGAPIRPRMPVGRIILILAVIGLGVLATLAVIYGAAPEVFDPTHT